MSLAKVIAKNTGVKEEDAEKVTKFLVKEGWVTCSLPRYEEILYHYKGSHSMQKTADNFGVSKYTVYSIIHRF